MKLKILILMLIILVISGCLTTGNFKSEPTEHYGSLIIGQIQMNVSDFDGLNMEGNHIFGIDGRYTYTVHVGITNTTQNKEYELDAKRMKDGKDFGLVYSSYLPVGDYQLDYFYAKKEVEANNTIFTYDLFAETKHTFKVEKGKVNNLGQIICYHKQKKIEKEFHDTGKIISESIYDVNKNYDSLKTYFMDKYPESAWNSKEWLNVKLTKFEEEDTSTEN